MIDLFFASLVPILGLAVALVGLVIFRLSRRDRPMAVVIALLGLAFVFLWFSAPEGAPPVGGTPSPAASATPDAAARLGMRRAWSGLAA